MRLRLLLAPLIILAASGCAEHRPDPGSWMVAADFRYNARGIYLTLLKQSCAPGRAPDGANALADEEAAMRRFEQKQAGSAWVRFQLEVARSDLMHKRTDCWREWDRSSLAQAMPAKDVRPALRQMEALASLLARSPHSPPEVPAEQGAAFRALARELVALNGPLCPIDRDVDEDTILAPAKAEFERFKRRLHGSPYEAHFDMAQGDVHYEQGLQSMECADPEVNVAAGVSRRVLAETRRIVARLSAIAGIRG